MKLKKCNIYDNNYEESLYWVITWNFSLSEGGRNFSGKGMNIFFLEGEAVGIYLGGFFSGGRNEQKFGY